MRRGLWLFLAAGVFLFGYAHAQVAAPARVTVTPVVLENEIAQGRLFSSLTGQDVNLDWIDAFGGTWFATVVRTAGAEGTVFSFRALGPATPVTFVRAGTSRRSVTAPLTIMRRRDDSWESFLVAADGPPALSDAAAIDCRKVAVTAAMASGYAESLASCQAGLRPIVYGLISPGSLSLQPDVFQKAFSAYEKSGSTADLARPSSLADSRETARLAQEAARQTELQRMLAPMCFVVADNPSVTRGNEPLDFSFADADLQGFRAFLQTRLPGDESLRKHWKSSEPASLVPKTAREIKQYYGKLAVIPVDFASWALHREYMDALFADSLRELSKAVSLAAKSPGPEDFNWSMVVPITAVTGVMQPSAYGGFDYTRLMGSANVLFLSPDAPKWAWGLARDLDVQGKVVPAIGAKSTDAASRAWCAARLGMAGLVVGDFSDLLAEAAGVEDSLAVLRPQGALRYQAGKAAAVEGPAALAAALNQMHGGLSDLMAASVNDAAVAIVYSPAAVRAGWMVQYLASEGPAPAASAAGTEALAAWSELLEQLGVDYKWITLESVALGELERAQYSVVILPETWCIDQQTANALGAYVSEGGTLIADNATGLLDGEYASYESPALDALFGVERRPLSSGRAKLLVPNLATDPKRIVADPSLVSTTQRTEAGAIAPGVVLKAAGKGGTVYLNMFVEPYLGKNLAAKNEIRTAVEKALAAGLVQPSNVVFQGDEPVPVRLSSRAHGTTRIVFAEPMEPLDPETAVEIRLPIAIDCYNLRSANPAGDFLGNNSTFFIPPPVSGPIVLSLERTRLTTFPLELEYSSNAIFIRTQLEGPGAIPDRLFHIRLYGPGGGRLWQFDRTVKAERGMFSGPLELPQNAPIGTYTVVVRDILTGVGGYRDVDVR